jgi:hypothetical protein
MANNVLTWWDRLNTFRTSRAGVVIFYGYLAAVLVAAALIAIGFVRLHTLAAQNHRVLCNQKQSYERVLAQALKFRHDHPQGTGIFTLGVIQSAIFQDRVQLRAFNNVVCGV